MRDTEITAERPVLYEEVDASTYRDQGRFERELDEVFTQHWLLAGRIDEVPDGGASPQVVARRELLLTRRGDDVRAFHNVCSHRGSLVVGEPCKSGPLRCPYHGWTYDLDGELIAVPREQRFADLDRASCALPSVEATTWGGWIWVHLGDDPEPFDRWLGGWREEIDRYRPEDQRIFERRVDEMDLNWKAAVDAFNETYHVAFIHPQTVGRLVDGAASSFRYEGHHSRMVIPVRRSLSQAQGRRSSSDSRRTEAAPAKELLPEQAQDHCNYTLFPNVVYNTLATWGIVLQFEPVSVGRTELRTVMLADPTVNDRQELGLEQQWNEFCKVLDEDLRSLQLVGRGVRSQAFRVARFGGEEERLVHFHDVVERTLER